MQDQIAAIILAGGRGTRLNSTEVNKVSLPFNGKPIISYGVSLLQGLASRIIVVVGAYASSVKDALTDFPKTIYVTQQEQLGTGHAAQVGMEALVQSPPKYVLVGYGDHMMFYKPDRIRGLIAEHERKGAVVTFVTAMHENPDELAWGRVERGADGHVQDIVEQKDANEKQRLIEELNAGFYCFNYTFLRDSLPHLTKSVVTGEYYLTELVKNACSQSLRVQAIPFPFEEVGIGVNASDELTQSQKLHRDAASQ